LDLIRDIIVNNIIGKHDKQVWVLVARADTEYPNLQVHFAWTTQPVIGFRTSQPLTERAIWRDQCDGSVQFNWGQLALFMCLSHAIRHTHTHTQHTQTHRTHTHTHTQHTHTHSKHTQTTHLTTHYTHHTTPNTAHTHTHTAHTHTQHTHTTHTHTHSTHTQHTHTHTHILMQAEALHCFNLHKDTTPPQPNHTVTPTYIEPEQYNT